ncbi:MAG TPA: SRPBCC domain-containing protein [Candidatus Angelobacter sp.]|nr:SRPBCC domain-containing protein [Candidatus Angelobacter sp.]
MQLPYRMERSVMIQARPETVFAFFSDSARWAKWWGQGSTIEARSGGKVYIRHPNGVETLGEVLEVKPPSRIVFTYGFAGGKPIPLNGSRVTINLEACEAGTRLHLVHEFSDAAQRDHHVQGWRFQLSVFANVVADEVFAGAAEIADAWFEAWAITDDGARDQAFTRIAAPDVTFRDRWGLLQGIGDLSAHAGASQKFMPGIRMRRAGDARQCQGTVLADWKALDAEGKERMSGTNVFVLRPDGRIQTATGFANPAAK